MGASIEVDEQVLATLATKTYPFCTNRTAVKAVSLLHSSELLSVRSQRGLDLARLDPAFFLPEKDAPRRDWADLSELLLQNFVSLRNQNSRWIAALTGGKDSRLVLAGLLRAGLQDETSFYIRAPEHHADTLVARDLSNQFGLDFSVKTRAPSENFFGDVDRHVLTTEGLLNLWDLKLPPDVPPYFGIHGLLGEVYRSQARSDSNAREKVTALLLADDPYGVRTPGQVKVETTWVNEWVSERLSQGVKPCELPDVFYLDQRIRRWMGQAKLSDGTWGIHCNPLFCLDILRKYYSLPQADRAHERIHFELMLQLEPSLARRPFAQASWHPTLLRPYEGSTTTFDTTHVNHSAPVLGTGWQIPVLESNWDRVRERILDSHGVWEQALDPDRIERLVDVVAASLGVEGSRRALKTAMRHPLLMAKVSSNPKAALQRVFGLLTAAAFVDSLEREGSAYSWPVH